jgi:hypothetical protein
VFAVISSYADYFHNAFYFLSLRGAILQLFYDLFLGAISRFPLYLLFRCATQKDVAAIGAKKIGIF